MLTPWEINSKKIQHKYKRLRPLTACTLEKVPFFDPLIKANNGKFFSTFDREDIFKLTKQPLKNRV